MTEQVIKGDIAIIKRNDDGLTQIETPEVGEEFAVYLKATGSYEGAKETERDYLTCDENGFAQTKAGAISSTTQTLHPLLKSLRWMRKRVKPFPVQAQAFSFTARTEA